MTVLNEILTLNSVSILVGNYRLIKFVINDNNVLRLLEDYQTLAAFNTATTPIAYKLHILLVINNFVYLLKIEKLEDEAAASTVSNTLLYTFPVFTEYGDEKISIQTIDFLDKVYFPINKIGTGSIGIGVYDVDDETFTIMDNSVGYEPTPYEVSQIGFNVLSTSPLSHIDDQGITFKSLRGMFLTKDLTSDTPIARIPLSGDFVLNVIHTGTSFNFEEVALEFTVGAPIIGEDADGNQVIIDGTPIDYVIDSVTDTGGIFKIKISGLQVSGVNNNIKIKLYDKLELTKFSFETNADLVPFRGIAVSDYITFTSVETKLYQRAALTNYNLTDYTELTIAGTFNYYSEMNAGNTVVGSYYKILSTRLVYYVVSSGVFTQILMQDTFKEYADVTLNVGETVELTTPNEKYYYNGNTTGTMTDFTLSNMYGAVLIDFEELSDLYEVGTDTKAEPVVGIDLTGINMLEIDNRLVVYKGNTIWFSELFQFDYLPNYNFITLPLQVTDEITRIVYFRGTHIIFTKEEIYKMSGVFGTVDFQINLINAFIGCIAPNTVRAVNNNIIFLSKEGLYQLKSSVYQDGLENVEKIDKKLTGMIEAIGRFDSIVYNEQYFLIQRNGVDFDVLRYYHNIDLKDRNHPFVRDKYAQTVPTFSYEGGALYTIRGGEWFIYDKGYTDLMPSDELYDNVDDYTYSCVMETSELMFGYPTHDKKFKSIFVKTINGEKVVPLFITIKIDGYKITDPYSYEAVRLDTGEIEYQVIRGETLNLVSEGTLGQIVLGLVPLGETKQEVHKILVSSKGKNISLKIEQKIDSSFGIQDIGYLHKLSKVRENR